MDVSEVRSFEYHFRMPLAVRGELRHRPLSGFHALTNLYTELALRKTGKACCGPLIEFLLLRDRVPRFER
jgi:hypothetical protein